MSAIRIAASMEYDADVGSLSADQVVVLLYRTIQGICQSIDGLHPAILGYAEVDNPGPEIRLFILEVKPPGEDASPDQ